MKPPIFVRSLSKQERQELEGGLRSSDRCLVLRRCQILLASARREHPPRIAENLGWGSQTVRNAIHDFNEKGLAALLAGSWRPKEVHAAFDEGRAESHGPTADAPPAPQQVRQTEYLLDACHGCRSEL